MIRWNTLFGGNVAEHSFLLVVVAAHSLVSLTFLHSDEFYQLKLQRSGIFQQAARRLRSTTLGKAINFPPSSTLIPRSGHSLHRTRSQRFHSAFVEQPSLN